MYLIRENGVQTNHRYLTNLTNDSSKEAGNLIFFPGSGGANYFHANGFPERTNIYWTLDTFISPDKVFIDIGAHVGSYTIVCATKASHTYAFECTPKTFCYLAANVALHNLESKVSLLPFALGNKEGMVDCILRTEDGGGNGMYVLDEADATREHVRIRMNTLDSFGIDNVGFIKIDVEGLELEVLQGAVETLKRSNYPKIMFECWSGDSFKEKREAIFAFLHELGYNKIVKVMGTHDMWLAEQ